MKERTKNEEQSGEFERERTQGEYAPEGRERVSFIGIEREES